MTDWVRLWHDMPTDPKWRVVARKSGQPLTCVISVFTMMLVNASANSDDRGTLSGWDDEDVAAAFDIDTEQVAAIREAMQGKVLEGNRLTGWKRRQSNSESNLRPPASIWAKIRARIFERDDYTCRYCGSRGGRLECDHVIPVAQGGKHGDDNLVTSCRSCNRKKRDRTPAEMGWVL